MFRKKGYLTLRLFHEVGLKKDQNNCYRCLGVYDMSFEECYLSISLINRNFSSREVLVKAHEKGPI